MVCRRELRCIGRLDTRTYYLFGEIANFLTPVADLAVQYGADPAHGIFAAVNAAIALAPALRAADGRGIPDGQPDRVLAMDGYLGQIAAALLPADLGDLTHTTGEGEAAVTTYLKNAAGPSLALAQYVWAARQLQKTPFFIKEIQPVTGWYDDGQALSDLTAPLSGFRPKKDTPVNAGYGANHEYIGDPYAAGQTYTGWAAFIYEHQSCGLWYKKCRKRGSASVGKPWESCCGGDRGSWHWNSTIGEAAGKKNTIRISMFSDAGPPVQAADNNLTARVYVQYGADFTEKARMKGFLFRQTFEGKPAIINWQNNAKDQNDDHNSQTIAVMNDMTVIPEDPDALRGEGAAIEVQSRYIHGDAGSAPKVKFRFRVTAAGLDYFQRDARSITARLARNDGTQDYYYTVSLPAQRGGDGALVLSGADAEGWAEAYVPAVLLNRPAEGAGAPAVLTNADGYEARGTLATVKQPDMQELAYPQAIALNGWRCTVTVKESPPDSGNTVSDPGFAYLDLLTVTSGNTRHVNASRTMEILPLKSYAVTVVSGGKYRREVKNLVLSASIAGTPDSRTAQVKVTETEPHRTALLTDYANPEEGVICQVTSDETCGGITTYWMHEGGERKEKTQIQFPQTEEGINGLQYVYSGAFAALAGRGCVPFILELREGSIFLDSFQIKQDADYDLTAPAEFGYRPLNRVPDPAVPQSFCRNASDSPGVIYYDSGRWWFASTPREPDRVWVSKPVKSRGDKALDFSTYINFLTVRSVLTPFKGRQKLGTETVSGPGEGVIGKCREALEIETRGKDVTFGIIRPEILGTPYFRHGAKVNRHAEDLTLDASSVSLPGEYTKDAMASLLRKTAVYTSLSRLKVSIPGAGVVVTADCDGFEVRTTPINLGVGVVVTAETTVQLIVPYTGWGTPAESAGIIAGAAAAAVLSVTPNPALMIAVGTSAAIILAAARVAVEFILLGMFNDLSLELTDGTTAQASRTDMMGSDYAMTSAYLQTKCGYLLAKNRLYEEEQPFILRTWEVKEDRYSTPGCAFTFRFSSEERESVNLITNIRSFFIATDASERIMPSAVNGEVQESVTGSFFGSERVQSAKAADAVYFAQKGGQRVMRAYWAPNVTAPVIGDMQKYNREILRGRKIISLKSARTLPVKVWCVLDDGTAAVITGAAGGGLGAWSRVTSGAGDIIESAALPVNGMDALRAAVIRDREGRIMVCAAKDAPGEPGDVFLDAWQEYTSPAQLADYTEEALVWDRKTGEVWPASDSPAPGDDTFIGYPYTSRMRTLPLAEAQALKPARIARARFRFMESALPFIRGYPSGAVNRITAHNPGRYLDGIADIPVPGNAELDAAFEVFTEEPEPLSIICFVTEEEA
jgi:hypothetical protein